MDGLHTNDDAYELSIAGGVTSALVLPGSLNAIGESDVKYAYLVQALKILVTGGQGITIKLRKTAERSPTAMLLEAPYQLNSSFPKPDGPPRWRQIK